MRTSAPWITPALVALILAFASTPAAAGFARWISDWELTGDPEVSLLSTWEGLVAGGGPDLIHLSTMDFYGEIVERPENRDREVQGSVRRWFRVHEGSDVEVFFSLYMGIHSYRYPHTNACAELSTDIVGFSDSLSYSAPDNGMQNESFAYDYRITLPPGVYSVGATTRLWTLVYVGDDYSIGYPSINSTVRFWIEGIAIPEPPALTLVLVGMMAVGAVAAWRRRVAGSLFRENSG